MIQELLQNTEREDKARVDHYIHCVQTRVTGRNSKGHTHGGSLQDLVDAVQSEHIDINIGGHSRRHHTSRTKKFSSVSTRTREGGSLPTNVNCTAGNNPEHLFPDIPRKISQIKSIDKNSLATAIVSRQDGNCTRSDDIQMIPDDKISHTIIEIESDETRHLLAHDSLAQVENTFFSNFT